MKIKEIMAKRRRLEIQRAVSKAMDTQRNVLLTEAAEEREYREKFWQNLTADIKKENAQLQAVVESFERAAKADAAVIEEQRKRYAELVKLHDKVMDSIKLVEIEATDNDIESALNLLERILPYVHTSEGDEEPGKFYHIQVIEE